MKALITSGGRGTRLRPITYTSNKHLIPVANKPMIYYAFEAVAEAGIKEVGITYNELTDEFKQAVGDGSKWGLKFEFIHQKAPIGLADCVRVAKDFISAEPFVFYLGDNILPVGIKQSVAEFKAKKSNCHLLLSRVPDPERFGVPTINDRGEIIKTEEKPQKPPSDFAITGIYMFDEHVWEAFEGKDAVKPSARGELEIPDVIQYLLTHQYLVTYTEVTGWWKDTGKMQDLLEANRLVLDKFDCSQIYGEVDNASSLVGDIQIEEGTVVKNSMIRGPVVIGKNVRIENSYIGPYTSIYHGCVIEDCEIEYSITLENAQIRGIDMRLDSSLIGNHAVVEKNGMRPKSCTLTIGDHSRVVL